MVVLTAETCWALNEYWIYNKISGIKLFSLYSTIKMMHGPINIRFNEEGVINTWKFCSKFLMFIDSQLRKYSKRFKFSQSPRDHSEGDICGSVSRGIESFRRRWCCTVTWCSVRFQGVLVLHSYVMFRTVSPSTWPQLIHTHTHRAGFLIEYYKLNYRILIFKPLIPCRRKGAFACKASNHFWQVITFMSLLRCPFQEQLLSFGVS